MEIVADIKSCDGVVTRRTYNPIGVAHSPGGLFVRVPGGALVAIDYNEIVTIDGSPFNEDVDYSLSFIRSLIHYS